MPKLFLFLFFLVALPGSIFSQVYQLVVENGYGSGDYSVGDTIHIWAAESSVTEVFKTWEGQISFLADPEEWHTTLIMPNHDVAVVALNKSLPHGAGFTEVHIMGRDTIKRVFYYFPPGGSARGVVWLLHGTGGDATQFVERFESRFFANRLMADSFAVITMESEETTKNKDLDLSGTIRWQYTPDSINNVDIANIRAIRDTFIAHGAILPGMPQLAAGFSAGGSLSVMIAWVLQWKAAVNHNTPGPGICADVSRIPTLFSMTYRDHHPDVGPEGNIEAADNYQKFLARDVCSEFYMFRPIPLHPERFRRYPGITNIISLGLYNELKTNNCLNERNYLTVGPDDVQLLAINNPLSWPVANSLTPSQQFFVHDQLQYIWSAHYFHSDFSGKDLRFLKDPCGMNTTSIEKPMVENSLFLYPNPALEKISLRVEPGMKYLYDISGKTIMKSDDNEFDISQLPPGIFFIRTPTSWGKFIHL
ncbi:MAG: hypothetical protein WAT91_16895 [Saprospiraceae bacterium]